jgi:hypothetical protein
LFAQTTTNSIYEQAGLREACVSKISSQINRTPYRIAWLNIHSPILRSGLGISSEAWGMLWMYLLVVFAGIFAVLDSKFGWGGQSLFL